MSKFNVAMKRFGGFMKRNAFYFLIVLCIASVATVIALAVTRDSAMPDNSLNVDDNPVLKPGDDDDKKPPVNPDDDKPEQKLTFYVPCNGTVSEGYSADSLVWSPTLKEYSTHMGIDFVCDDGNVYAAADGAIKETGYNDLDGYYVVISHADGYQTCYKSLDKPCTLEAGAKVEHGQLIGAMSDSQGAESSSGAHLHFEVLKNGDYIDPLEVLTLEEK